MVSDGRHSRRCLKVAQVQQAVKGPYILTDLRYGDGPLFVRYGAFTARWYIHDDGRRSPALRSPDNTLISDHRHQVFSVPEFIRLPIILHSHLSRAGGTLESSPYEFERALHFSNAGGVYLARHKVTRERVVIREARPYAGLDGDGNDAICRLANERSLLSKLQGVACVPELIEYRAIWEHHFLVEEYIDGATLLEEIIRRYPLVHFDVTNRELTEYVSWAVEISHRLECATKEIHARGVSIGDLHPSNILVSSTGEVRIVDFECASDLNKVPLSSTLGAPGFSAQTQISGEAADCHALDHVRLMLSLPIVPLISLHEAKRNTLVRVACGQFPLDSERRNALEAMLQGDSEDDLAATQFESITSDWTQVRDSIVRGMLAAATPERDDRLVPGDPLQFSFGGATLAYGAAGVLLAIKIASGKVPLDAVEWLVSRSSNGQACFGGGLYDGLHGVAYTLSLVGARDAALEVFNRLRSAPVPTSIGLFGGRAGVALNLLHFRKVTGDESLFDTALAITEDLRTSLIGNSEGGVTLTPGLFHGATGPALLFLYMYAETGQERYLDSAEQALRMDLAFGTTLPDGAFHIRSGSRYLIYIDGGSAGIGLVLARYLEHRNIADLTTVLHAIYRGCQIPFALQPGLFQGKASQIALLSQGAGKHVDRSAVIEQVSRLAWYAVFHEGSICFPGSRLIRLSCDLATGSAGVLLALRSAFEGGSLGLPFL